MSAFVNDPKALKEIELSLQFAASYEAVKHKERALKETKAKLDRDKHYCAAITKMGLSAQCKVYRKHVQRCKLTIAQMKAVAFVDCGETVTGRAEQVRTQLLELLPKCPDPDTEDESDYDDMSDLVDVETSNDTDSDGVSEFATQDQHANIEIMVSIEDMQVGDCVEVWWQGDKKWYEGRITGVDLDLAQFDVEYFEDDKELTHNDSEYKVRMAV